MEMTPTLELLGPELEGIWRGLADEIDQLYEMERLWNKGFGSWTYEYKYRRGGKTLCTFYFRQGTVNLLIVLGKAEREKFEARQEEFTPKLRQLYSDTPSYHDGKWLWIPVDGDTACQDILGMLKIKRRPNRK